MVGDQSVDKRSKERVERRRRKKEKIKFERQEKRKEIFLCSSVLRIYRDRGGGRLRNSCF